jgi:hypothetical protein
MDCVRKITYRIHDYFHRIKHLEGNPHEVALGLAIGVYIGITPTIPFHTLLALFLSFVLKGSKVAAALGVWISNPITIPVFYFLSFKIGTWILHISMPIHGKPLSLIELIHTGVTLTAAAVFGGLILGILPGIATYWSARKIFFILRRSKEKHQRPIESQTILIKKEI